MLVRHFILATTAVLSLLLPVSASAQVFGTFTWQMEPYCNRITLTLSSTTAGFTVDGKDDLCGANTGSAYGVAVFTPGGTVALNFTIVPTPNGKGIHVSAVVNPGTGDGTWTDSAGRSGLFTLGGPGGGSARPDPTVTVPPGSITATELANGAVGSAKVDSSQVQLRVGGACPAGQLMTGVNANGTVVCAAPASSGTFACVNTTVQSVTIGPNTNNFFNNPSCPAGYAATTPYCWTAAFGVYSQGSGYNSNAPGNPTFCAWQNTTGSNQTVFGGNVCCRVQ